MPSPPLLDFETLVTEIPGDDPAGRSVPFATREKMEEARKEINPEAFPADDPRRPAEPKRADWRLIERLAQETLRTTSKDLLTTARLVEALVKLHGFAGLRDGLHLFRRLIVECWDRLYPPIEEEGDIEVRAAAFIWLDDPDRGSRFPTTLHTVPLISGRGGSYDWLKWRNSQIGKGSLEGFDEAIMSAPRETCQTIVDDLDASVEELDLLIEALSSRMGQHSPGLGSMRQAAVECQVLARQILAKKGPAPDAAPAAELPAENVEEVPTAGPRASKSLTTRADAYQQVAMAAAVLKQIEPHSPIPYLLERAVELGSLPFPELMKVLVRNAEVLDAMNRELGIKQPAMEE